MNLGSYTGALSLGLAILLTLGRCARKEKTEDVCSAYSGGRSPLSSDSDNSPPTTRTQPWRDMEYLSAPDGRIFHSAIWSGEQLLVWGGIVGGLSPAYTNSGSSYNPSTNQWASMSGTSDITERFGHCAVWTGNRMFIWGGENAGGLRDDGFLYNPSTNSWIAVSTTDAPSARLWHSCKVYADKVYLWGGVSGSDSDILGSGAIYDPNTDAWTDMASTGGIPYGESMFGAAILVDATIIYYNAVSGQIARYDLTNDTWESLSDTGIPDNRYGFAYSFDGNSNQFFVWGGGRASGGENLQDMFSYDISNDSWSSLSSTNAPSARIGASLNLLDNQLYLWGGWSASTDSTLNDGAIYNIADDSWTSLNTTAAPTARILHSQTSTSNGFIVWGGTGYLPKRSSGDQVVAYLRDGAKQAITEAQAQVEQTTAAGEEALDQLKAKVGAINLTGCDLFLTDDSLFEFLFSLAVGGAGGVYEPISSDDTDDTVSLPSGQISSSAAITAVTSPSPAAAPATKERNCWNPYP